MAIKRWNLCTKKTYGEGQNAKNFWPNIGTMVYFPANGEKKEGFKIELNMFPALQIYVFENQPKEQRQAATPAPAEYSEPQGEISADSIPY